MHILKNSAFLTHVNAVNIRIVDFDRLQKKKHNIVSLYLLM